MSLAVLALLPAALLLDRLFGEPPSRVHPVCMMGALAAFFEKRLRRGPNSACMFLRGMFAALLVIVPCAAAAAGIVLAVQHYGGARPGWFAAAALVYICLAPRSLAEHAQCVAAPLAAQDIDGARKAVALLVGRNTDGLDACGTARACVESVAENLVDGVLSTLFWAGAGLLLFGCPGAACLAVLHRSANVLDALWGKKNEIYVRFGTCAARLDDALNCIPARLSLPCIALASRMIPHLRPGKALSVGWKYRAAHESPNSAWSEAAFAGALGLRLGGPAVYGDTSVAHPWLGEGTPEATHGDIRRAVQLMRQTVFVFTLFEVFTIGLIGLKTGGM